MKVGFIGAGKVGFSLGRFLSDNGIQVTGYYSWHIESARQAAEFTDSKCYEEMELLVKDSDVVFLTVPDGAIKSIYEQIKSYDISNKQICHCSGALSSTEVFSDVKKKGAYGYSIHPLFPISDKLNSYKEMPGAFFCLEGDGPGIKEWESFFRNHCKGVKLIDSKNKVKYHAACAIASNLYCALIQESLELLKDCGFDKQEALEALAPLVESNVKHILEEGPENALTGPVERGDVGTVEKHIHCLSDTVSREMYLAATRKLISIARQKNPQRDYSKLCDKIVV
ncbi:MAG: Rossmann-like and DUF2520 domain-containing protein [Lachnospiraceae bacterium]